MQDTLAIPVIVSSDEIHAGFYGLDEQNAAALRIAVRALQSRNNRWPQITLLQWSALSQITSLIIDGTQYFLDCKNKCLVLVEEKPE